MLNEIVIHLIFWFWIKNCLVKFLDPLEVKNGVFPLSPKLLSYSPIDNGENEDPWVNIYG
jgi:hypothetical protein